MSKSEDRTIEINQSERQRKKIKENDQSLSICGTLTNIPNFSIIRIPAEGAWGGGVETGQDLEMGRKNI